MLAALVVLGVLGASCGGDGPSMDDWREEAAAACQARDETMKAVPAPLGMADVAGVSVKWIESSEKARAAIVAAERPEGAEANPAEELTTAMAALIETLRPWSDTVRGEDLAAIETGADGVMEKAKAVDQKAEAAGVMACATTLVLMDGPIRGAARSGVAASFRAKMEGICPKLEGAQAELDKLDGRAWIDRALRYLADLAAEVRAVSPPPSRRELYEKYLQNLDAFREKVLAVPRDLRRTNEAAVEGGLSGLLVELEATGSVLGIGECRNGPT